MDYKLELGKLLKHCIKEANKRKNATAPLDRGVRMGYQNIRFAIDEIFERAHVEADTGENNALLPDVSKRTCINCHNCVVNPTSKYNWDKHKCFAREQIITITNRDEYKCDKWTERC